MRRRRPRRRAILPVVVVATISAVSLLGITAANVVATSRADELAQSLTADQLKPVDCNAIALTTVVVGSTGTAGSDLLIGSGGADLAMNGGGGNDCILGGGGLDILDGGPGTDVCIGGPGLDFFTNCETQIQ